MYVTDRFAPERYDYFVVGSGPAGVSLALALAERKKRVLIFESGDEDNARTELSNSIGYGHYSGEYWNGHWVRALGGTSNVWTGWCTTFRELDLDNPVVGAKWPISRAELLPYWKKAAPILDHDAEFIDFEKTLYPGFSYRPVTTPPPTRIGDKYRARLKADGGVDVALGRSLVAIDANRSRSLVTTVDYYDHLLELRRQIAVAPRQTVILAAGGLGNAQLLMQPRADGGVPVGNESGEAGKYLMEHPQFNNAGEVVMDAELDRHWPAANTHSGVHVIAVDKPLSLEHGLYGCGLQCSKKTADHELARYLTREAGRPFFHYEITARSEMLPVATNRVVPSAERDRSGFHRLIARCVLDARDFMNVENSLRVFGESLIKLGKGRVRINNDRIYKDVWGEGHTLGTTRMGGDQSASVVDPDCRVHGYHNLFVAGSSVFPSGGYTNPTITIVALALRLADKLVSTT
jgi:choline dehydrogenase-like flavoprotein